MHGREQLAPAVNDGLDRTDVLARSDLIDCHHNGRHGADQHHHALRLRTAVEHIGADADIILRNAGYLQVAIITLIANARYLLMSCALAQRFSPDTPFFHRFLIGYDVTDELFGITIARPGWLNPYYTYGAILVAAPAWSIGTALGIIAGNLLPLRAVSALSVALYGMFLAIIIPPARKSRVVAGLVAVSFFLSFICSYLPGISTLSDGTRTILLTVLISCAGAILFPVKTEEENADVQ